MDVMKLSGDVRHRIALTLTVYGTGLGVPVVASHISAAPAVAAKRVGLFGPDDGYEEDRRPESRPVLEIAPTSAGAPSRLFAVADHSTTLPWREDDSANRLDPLRALRRHRY